MDRCAVTSNVINGLTTTRSKRARKVVNYKYDDKELDEAIREFNSDTVDSEKKQRT